MNKLFLDTNIWIYLMEDKGARGQRALQIFSTIASRGDTILVSPLILGELLVKPLRAHDRKLADRYRQAMQSAGVKMLAMEETIAESFALLRIDGIKPQDALHLSVAAHEGCDLFITNDDRLARAVVPGIRFIASMDRAPL